MVTGRVAGGARCVGAFRKKLVHSLISLVSCLLLAVCLVAEVQAEPAVDGEFIIKFKRSSNYSSRTAIASRLGVRATRSLPLTGAQVVEINNGKEFDAQYAKELLASGAVEYIEPNYIYTINSTPNDPDFSSLWGLHNSGQTGGTNDVDVDAPEAWDMSTGSEQVVVGVIDTGVNYDHPDLSANMWVNPGEIAGNGVDDDGNGVIDDVYGYNAITGSGDPMDDHSHGSHCAGTIGGVGDNGVGVAGVNWNVKIMGLKFLSASGSGSTSDAIAAIEYAVQMKQRGVNIKVLSNSWGGGGFSQALEDAIEEANDAGILFTAAAGNNGSDNDSSSTYPANYDTPNVVSVAAIDHDGNLAYFSNYGATTVDVAAPGVSILSTVLGDDYASYNGTSMATPHVSGVAALLAGYSTSLSTTEIKSRLMGTVKPLSSLSGQMVSAGIVSALNALTNTQAPTPAPTPTISYTKETATYSFDSDLGTRISTADDAYLVQNLGFTLSYFEENFTSIVVSTNGRIIPGDTPPSGADYSHRLNAGINPFHTDLYPASSSDANGLGGVWFKTDSRVAVITWVMMHYGHRTSGSAESVVTVQAKLYADGRIEFHYNDTYTGDSRYDYAAFASVGLVSPTSVNGEKLTVSDDEANQAELGNGRALRLERPSANSVLDFDGDGRPDFAVWRPTLGFWFVLTSSSGYDFNQQMVQQWGLYGDIPVPADYSGDGVTDYAVWRPSDGTWYVLNPVSGAMTAQQWGLPGDTPIPGDYDGDGSADMAVSRAAMSSVYILRSASGFNRDAAMLGDTSAVIVLNSGGSGYDPLPGADVVGNGRDEVITVTQTSRFWVARDSSGTVVMNQPWGVAGDTPVACDRDADGVDDRIVIRAEGIYLNWYTVTAAGSVLTDSFGLIGDVPSCNKDYDQDGTNDLVVYRPATGTWYIQNSGDKSVSAYQFGLNGDQTF